MCSIETYRTDFEALFVVAAFLAFWKESRRAAAASLLTAPRKRPALGGERRKPCGLQKPAMVSLCKLNLESGLQLCRPLVTIVDRFISARA